MNKLIRNKYFTNKLIWMTVYAVASVIDIISGSYLVSFGIPITWIIAVSIFILGLIHFLLILRSRVDVAGQSSVVLNIGFFVVLITLVYVTKLLSIGIGFDGLEYFMVTFLVGVALWIVSITLSSISLFRT